MHHGKIRKPYDQSKSILSLLEKFDILTVKVKIVEGTVFDNCLQVPQYRN